jgi:transcriptional regulator with XRE-family HTH domain
MNISKIRKLMREKEITQKFIASQMGLSPNAISQKLKKGDFNVSDLEKMAEILQVSVKYFFEDDKRKEYEKLISMEYDTNKNEDLNSGEVRETETIYRKIDNGEIRALKETIEILKGEVEYFKNKYEQVIKNK